MEIIEIIYTGIMEIIEIMYRLRDWAWPFVALIFIIIFNKPIFEFLLRLKTLKIFGMGVEAAIPVEQKVEEIKKSLPPEEEIIKDIEEEDRETITKKYIEILKKYKEHLEDYKFELTLNLIYGTQMDLLEYLSKRETLRAKYSDLNRFYNNFLIRSKFATTTTITKYFGFLKKLRYIEYVGEGEEQIVKITPNGLDFLSYVKKLYLTTYKDRPGMKF